jgi:metallophosphoesterase superfamily enzyme
VLVRGNHDILKSQWYEDSSITVIEKDWQLGPFLFTHEKCDDHRELYTFCGHLHPGIHLNGLGKQSLRFPCFYFGETHCTLPAFSKFTGVVSVHPKVNEHVFAVVENSVIQVC